MCVRTYISLLYYTLCLRAQGREDPYVFHIDESIRACTIIVQHGQVIAKVALLKSVDVVRRQTASATITPAVAEK
jgi:hypothetical protein